MSGSLWISKPFAVPAVCFSVMGVAYFLNFLPLMLVTTVLTLAGQGFYLMVYEASVAYRAFFKPQTYHDFQNQHGLQIDTQFRCTILDKTATETPIPDNPSTFYPNRLKIRT